MYNSYGLGNMGARLKFRGGYPQQDRMIKDKRETLDRSITYSYQGAKIKDVQTEQIAPALINPNKLKPDYDDKILSVGFEYKYKPGMVFDWLNTGTRWLIYLQDLTELAYFKGDIRRCQYEISFKNSLGEINKVPVALRGPVETKINFIQKEGISVDTPNHSLHILMPSSEEALKYFQRYSKFYLQGLSPGDKPICWRVEATDSLSMPGILEVIAVEYFINSTEDNVEEGLVGDLVVQPIIPETPEELITGENFISPKVKYTFKYKGNENSQWNIKAKYAPIEYTINNKEITLIWTKTYSGQFILTYGSSEKTIIVESLF